MSCAQVVGERRLPRAQSAGEREPARLEIGQHDLLDALLAQRERGEQPDRPGADDQHLLVGLDGAAAGGVHADGQRLDEHAPVGRDAGVQRQRVGGRDRDEIAQPARVLTADERHRGADVRLAAPAVVALAAADRREHRHALPRLDAVHAAAGRLDRSVELVAEPQRRLQLRVAAGEELEVGSAEAALGHADDHFALAGRGQLARLDADRAGRADKCGTGFHAACTLAGRAVAAGMSPTRPFRFPDGPVLGKVGTWM